jgi:Carboxypeptidase regulatory-like domain
MILNLTPAFLVRLVGVFFSATVIIAFIGLTVLQVGAQTKFAFAPPNLDQCSNGSLASAECVGDWQNGNLNESNSHYIEGESVPYRITFSDLAPNSVGNSILIEWDTTEGGKHALDYLTSFNRTEPNANPCAGFTCNPLVYSDFPIPMDSHVSTAGVTQLGGQFLRMYNGTITGVSAYSMSGSYASTSQTSFVVTFDVGADPNVVLAFGGHISRRADWGIDNAAASLSGSPYHMRISGQDRSLKVSAVIFPAQITVIQEITGPNGETAMPVSFPFSATNLASPNFSLVDMNSQPADRFTDSDVTAFGPASTKTVTQSLVYSLIPLPWTLNSLICSETTGGLGLPNLVNSTVSIGTRTASIIAEVGEFVTCVFRNIQLVPTAATATISGRVTSSTGRGIGNAFIQLTGGNISGSRYARTNPFGYYRFDDVSVGDVYILNAESKRYTFQNPTRVINLTEDLTNQDFVSN